MNDVVGSTNVIVGSMNVIVGSSNAVVGSNNVVDGSNNEIGSEHCLPYRLNYSNIALNCVCLDCLNVGAKPVLPDGIMQVV